MAECREVRRWPRFDLCSGAGSLFAFPSLIRDDLMLRSIKFISSYSVWTASIRQRRAGGGATPAAGDDSKLLCFAYEAGERSRAEAFINLNE